MGDIKSLIDITAAIINLTVAIMAIRASKK